MGGAKNCPETPRQRMIGMMYLVLTAMLALNVSAAILNGYMQVDENLHASIESNRKGNKVLYQRFHFALEQNEEKVRSWYDKSLQVRSASDTLFNYIQNFKDRMVEMADGKKKALKGATVRDMNKKDDTNIPHQYGLKEKHGTILKNKINEYALTLKTICAGNNALSTEIDSLLATKTSINSDRKVISWEQSLFEEMPICATITMLSKIQNDILHVEGKVVEYLLQATDASDIRVNKLQAYVIPKSDYIIRGSKYSARIILAAVDSTQQPEYYIEGNKISEDGLYEVTASGLGMKRYKGHIAYHDQAGVLQNINFESSYIVAEPSVTISNTDLNIMYRGYENKFSISAPGFSNDKVRVSVSGAQASQRGNMWIIKPGESSKEVRISVSVESEEKRKQDLGSFIFRVKALPKPGAYFRSRETEYSDGNISRSALLDPSATIIASYGPDGLLDIPFKISSFKLNIAGDLTDSRGNSFTKQQSEKLGKLKKGAIVVITDIRAKGPDGNDIRLSPIPLTLN